MTSWVPLDSSNLAAARYHVETSTLDVRFKSGTWSYPNVSPDMYQGLLDAESPGRYFHNHIRRLPDAARLDELAPIVSSSQTSDDEQEPGRGATASPHPAPLPPGLVSRGVVRTRADGRLYVTEEDAIKALGSTLLAWLADKAEHDMASRVWVLP